ncbi:MAG TPA: glycosyl hydrolase family 17 protein [Marinilabiliaceae bacterium]|nr:glycosyl hydrolase family 17 protein [Marinilabiliaceae bacterium]
MKKLMPLLLAATIGLLMLAGCSQPSSDEPKGVRVESLTVTPSEITNLQISDKVAFTVKANYSNGTTKTVSRASSYSKSEHYALNFNTLTATTEGEGKVTITYEGVSVDVPYNTVDLYEKLELVVASFTGGVLEAKIGDSIPITANLTLKDGSEQTVTTADGLTVSGPGFFLSSGENGMFLRAVDGGEGTLTATYKSKTASIQVKVPNYEFGTRRFIPNDVLSLRAYSFSGYRKDQSPDLQKYPSVVELTEDLELMHKANIHFLRLYDTSVHAERTLEAMKETGHPFKVQLGIWIAGNDDTAGVANWKSIDGALALIEEYPEFIASISVGNECMVDWNKWWTTSPEDMKAYIQYVRANVTVPVTTDDNWEPFAEFDIKNDDGETGILAKGIKIYRDGDASTPYNTDQVARVVDYLAIHTYPIADTPWGIWDWEQKGIAAGPERGVAMMNLSIIVAKKQYQAARDHIDAIGLTDLPIIIGETGWKHRDTSSWAGRSHPVNAKMYYDRMMEWVYGSGRGATQQDGPWVCFYFEAFDEPWKSGDDGWGLFNVEREPTYTLWAQSDTDGFVRPKSSPEYTDDDVAYFGKK